MKNVKNVLAILLILCSLTALVTAGAYADGPAVSVPTVMSTGSGSTQTASFSAQEGKWIYQTSWVLDDTDGGRLYLDPDTVSSDLNFGSYACINVVSNNAQAGNYRIHCNFKYENDDTTYTAEGTVTVEAASTPVPVSSIQVYDPAHTDAAIVGTEKQLACTVLPDNAANRSVSWAVDNGASITQDGKLTAYYAGEVHVSVSALDGSGVYGTLKINVSEPAPDPTIALTPAAMNLVSGNSDYIRADVGNASGKTIHWTSSGNVTVYPSTSTSGSSVLITANAGITMSETASVTATIEGTSISKTCTVTITPSGVKHIDLTSDDYSPNVGETITVSADIKYSTPGDQVSEWKFDSSILQCTEVTGSHAKFKALKAGKTKVTAISDRAQTFIDIDVGGGQVLNHQITYGNYSTFDGANPLYFITNDYITNFKGVTVDGYALTNGNQYYAASSSDGHILVTLNPAYLKLLSSANYHTIQIYSNVNQPATGYFRNYGVSQTIYGVRTGDDNNIALWVTLCLIGFAGAAAIVITKRREIFGK